MKKRQVLKVPGSAAVTPGQAKAAAKRLQARSQKVTNAQITGSDAVHKYLGHFGSAESAQQAKKKIGLATG